MRRRRATVSVRDCNRFAALRSGREPIPTDLRRAEFYHHRGKIVDYNNPVQVAFGDIDITKDYANDDNDIGSQVINTLIKAHCFWIREADVDGFRVDAVKHMPHVPRNSGHKFQIVLLFP